MSDAQPSELIERLQQRIADLELLTYRCAHDLKGRLIALAAYLKGLPAHGKSDRWDDFDTDLGRMSHLLEKSNLLLDDVLLFANLNREAPSCLLSISHLVRTVYEHAKATGPLRTWRLTETGECPMVMGQEAQLLSVLENLFENAAKFTTTPEGPVCIDIGYRREAENLVVHVRDCGVGIPVADRECVFEPFVRLDRRAPGTGLGLWIVRHMVHRHGGRAWIESPDGPGTVVCFTLPIASS